MRYMYILLPDAHFTQLLPVTLKFKWTGYISNKQGLHGNVGSKLTILEIFPSVFPDNIHVREEWFVLLHQLDFCTV